MSTTTKDTTLTAADDSDEQPSTEEQPTSPNSGDQNSISSSDSDSDSDSIPEEDPTSPNSGDQNSISSSDSDSDSDSIPEEDPDSDEEEEEEDETSDSYSSSEEDEIKSLSGNTVGTYRPIPLPRKDSKITDFHQGYDKPIDFRDFYSREAKEDEEEEKDDGEEEEDEAFSIEDQDAEDIEDFMKLHFSKEMTEEREKSILKQFDWTPNWFDYPVDPEKWTEMDNLEVWTDRPLNAGLPGYDPNWPDDKDVKAVNESVRIGTVPVMGPLYVPYRKYDPDVTDHHPDAHRPKQVIEELDMMEEFMQWNSCVFLDGSSYEGTVFDDVAQGKGVYISPQGLVRYEGEWFRNYMEGHGVTEVELPDYQPVPGSPYEAEMREKGEIITRDFMSPKDRKWLEMDIDDMVFYADQRYAIPFYENNIWLKFFNSKPEKGRYRYAGQWKHGRMHGCGVYEANERVLHGRFYFGDFTGSTEDCDSDTSAMHAGLAEVAAAKARMFMNKPDGMVREDAGPFNDPQHPYYYEGDDAWMAPGFVHQFHEVPDYWKAYVDDVDEEREMWLNSFYKAPLRLPMPAELEHWWSKDEATEFELFKGEAEPDPEDPTKLIDPDPLIFHIPTGRLINYVDDEEHGVRLYWMPQDGDKEEEEDEETEEIEVEGTIQKVKFLPDGFDEFKGRRESVVKVRNPMLTVIKGACKIAERWIKKKKKASDKRKKIVEKKLDLVEAETTLKETIEDEDEELSRLEKEELKKLEEGLIEEDDIIIPSEETSQLDEKDSDDEGEGEIKEEKEAKNEEKEKEAKNEEKEKEDSEDSEEEVEEEDDEVVPTSFGSIIDDQDSTKSDQEGKKNGRSPFASLSLPFASLVLVPSQLQLSFSKWKESKLPPKISPPSSSPSPFHSCIVSPDPQMSLCSVSFPRSFGRSLTLRAGRHALHKGKHVTRTRMRSHARHKTSIELHRKTADGGWIWPATDQGKKLNILSLHTVL